MSRSRRLIDGAKNSDAENNAQRAYRLSPAAIRLSNYTLLCFSRLCRSPRLPILTIEMMDNCETKRTAISPRLAGRKLTQIHYVLICHLFAGVRANVPAGIGE